MHDLKGQNFVPFFPTLFSSLSPSSSSSSIESNSANASSEMEDLGVPHISHNTSTCLLRKLQALQPHLDVSRSKEEEEDDDDDDDIEDEYDDLQEDDEGEALYQEYRDEREPIFSNQADGLPLLESNNGRTDQKAEADEISDLTDGPFSADSINSDIDPSTSVEENKKTLSQQETPQESASGNTTVLSPAPPPPTIILPLEGKMENMRIE